MLIATLILLGVTVAVYVARPRDHGGPHRPEMIPIEAALKTTRPGRNVALLDLDVLDRNADAIRAAVRPDIAIRLVTKSLPSFELLDHLMARVHTDRLMVFSEPYLDAVLDAWGDRVDVLLGLPLPVEAARRILARHGRCERVCWLVDDVARANAYAALAEEVGHPLRVCVEVDVGLRRGGAGDEAALQATLGSIADHPTRLQLGGLMGYDGHVPHAPPVIADSDDEFAALHARYSALLDAGRAAYPALFTDGLLFDGGGSGTYARYTSALSTPIDEVAIGSAFTAPVHFAAQRAAGLERVLTLAAPVLKRIEPPRMPFRTWAGPLFARWDRNRQVNLFLLGGRWPAEILSPPGLTRHPLWGEGPTVVNLLPNQPLLTGSRRVTLAPGDVVFFDPWQGDAMVGFAELTLMRDGRVTGTWATYRGGQ